MDVEVKESKRKVLPHWRAKVSHQGNITEVTYMPFKPPECPVKKVSQGVYVDTRTGEKIIAKEGQKRVDNTDSIKKTMYRLRAIINTNCVIAQNIRWVTLTYAENMQEVKQLMKDFDAFRKRFNRWLENQGIDKPEYISVVEPQGRGAWHLHIIYIWENKAPYIDNKDLERIWKHGFTKIKACENVDNIGAYFTAYLADMPVNKLGTCTNKDIKIVNDEKGNKKAIVKGARLEKYPKGLNIYRTSRGIKKPEEEEKKAREIKRGELGQLTYKKAIDIYVDGKYIRTVIREYYNKIRK